jgi:3-hydroxyisobutyrate dehydrogenase-like beta-hydroxyacid dehydrogenase
LGFIGLGVMGAPMCRNLQEKSGRPVVSYDRATKPQSSIPEVSRADVVFLSLPGEKEIREVCDELLAHARPDQIVVDCSTAPVALAQSLAREFTARGARFADAPVARTRQAAVEGTLSIMVGAEEAVFRRIEPLLRCMASDVTHCGAPGAGQAVKLLNNMVLSITVVALAEALAVAKASGVVDPRLLFETLAKGSADSFALRSHGMKALLPESHPERAFPVSYMLKDVAYAIELARGAGLDLQGAGTAKRLLEETTAIGLGDAYHTALIEAVRRHRAG